MFFHWTYPEFEVLAGKKKELKRRQSPRLPPADQKSLSTQSVNVNLILRRFGGGGGGGAVEAL